jgi:hypothetical protein
MDRPLAFPGDHAGQRVEDAPADPDERRPLLVVAPILDGAPRHQTPVAGELVVEGEQILGGSAAAGANVENQLRFRRQQFDESPVRAFRCEWLIASRHDGRMRASQLKGTRHRKINQDAVDPLTNLADACKNSVAQQRPREETRHFHPLVSISRFCS